jgi:hypothetical protein
MTCFPAIGRATTSSGDLSPVPPASKWVVEIDSLATIATLGLSLAQAKAVLVKLQAEIVEKQIGLLTAGSRREYTAARFVRSRIFTMSITAAFLEMWSHGCPDGKPVLAWQGVHASGQASVSAGSLLNWSLYKVNLPRRFHMPIEPGTLDQAHDGSRTLTCSERARKQPVASPDRNRSDLVLDPVVSLLRHSASAASASRAAVPALRGACPD